MLVNVIQHPMHSGRRNYKLEQAIHRAVASFVQHLRVAVVGTGIGLLALQDGAVP
nr:hypothetical protein [Marinobacterium sedimentorum]